jgi:hypothetical protein
VVEPKSRAGDPVEAAPGGRRSALGVAEYADAHGGQADDRLDPRPDGRREQPQYPDQRGVPPRTRVPRDPHEPARRGTVPGQQPRPLSRRTQRGFARGACGIPVGTQGAWCAAGRRLPGRQHAAQVHGGGTATVRACRSGGKSAGGSQGGANVHHAAAEPALSPPLAQADEGGRRGVGRCADHAGPDRDYSVGVRLRRSHRRAVEWVCGRGRLLRAVIRRSAVESHRDAHADRACRRRSVDSARRTRRRRISGDRRGDIADVARRRACGLSRRGRSRAVSRSLYRDVLSRPPAQASR